MIPLLSLGIFFGSGVLIAMGRETLRLRHSGSGAAMAAHQAQTGQAYTCVVIGAIGVLLAVWLVA